MEGDFAFKSVPSSTPQTSSAPQQLGIPEPYTKLVAHCKWKLIFTGKNKKESVHSFLEKVARGISILGAYDLFRGLALTWFNSIKFKVSNWDELGERLRTDFLLHFYDEDLQREKK